MLRVIDATPVKGESSVHVDDQLLRDVFRDPDAIARIYAQDPERFRALIEGDANADDVIALRRRREVAQRMRNCPAAARARPGGDGRTR